MLLATAKFRGFFLGMLFAFFMASTHGSAQGDEPSNPERAVTGNVDLSGGLHSVDWLLIGIYALTTIGLGVYFSRRQSTTKEYFVGSGNINPALVGVSLFATLLSTISYLAMPGEACGKGPVVLVGLLGLPIVYLIVGYALLPTYMRHRVTSAYELLEVKLGLSIRLLGASLFLILRLVWMTLLVYLAAKAMTVMLGVDYWIIELKEFSIQPARFSDAVDPATELPGLIRWNGSEMRVAASFVIVLFTGVVSLIYTSLGGLQAVIITDFMQTVLLFGGACLVIVIVTFDMGGLGWFPTKWQPNWDTQPILSFSPKTRVTVVGSALSIMVWYIATLGGDQTAIQRFMATTDAQAARRAIGAQLTVAVVVQLTLALVGFALLSYFGRHDEHLAGFDIKQDADDLFPRFVSYHLPIGISGLVVAAMFAAAMSSIDSGVNSITAVVMSDFLERFGWKPKTRKGHLRTAQCLAIGIGLTVLICSSSMKYIEGNITEVTGKTVNLLPVPIFSLFFFALFVPFARPVGVWVGAVLGTLAAASIAFSGPLVYFLHSRFGIDPAIFNSQLITKWDAATGSRWTTAEDPVSFQWMGVAALIVSVSSGTIVSYLVSKVERKSDSQTTS